MRKKKLILRKKKAPFFLLLFFLLGGLLSGCSSGNGVDKNSAGNSTWQCPSQEISGGPAEAKEEDGFTMWFEPEAVPLKGVAIVVHGLNLKPARMNDIVHHLQKKGIKVLRVTLKGHDGSAGTAESMGRIEADEWRRDVFLAYCQGRQISRKNSVPLYSIGYSLGGLLLLDMMASPERELDEDIVFDKMVFFAPAVRLKWYTFLLKGLYILGQDWVVDSWNPRDYRANEGTTMAAYKVLFSLSGKSENWDFSKINRPTLVFMDSKDELVNFKGTQKLLEERQLNHWRMYRVEPDKKKDKRNWHHLIIDRPSVGQRPWEAMMKELESFLLK